MQDAIILDRHTLKGKIGSFLWLSPLCTSGQPRWFQGTLSERRALCCTDENYYM